MASTVRVPIIRLMETSFSGPPIDDAAILAQLPDDISAILRQQNGFIAANGGFHVRGACIAPAWHSLRAAWEGEYALHHLYPDVAETDIPQAEDRFQQQSGPLVPGYLINVYPPLVTKEGRNPSLRAIPALELRSAHADFAKQIRDIPDGSKIEIKIR